MTTSYPLAKELLAISSIIEKHQQEEIKSGNQFNIFSILNLTSHEVRLHSNFIATLLDAKGKHGFGNQFCKLFLTSIRCNHHATIIDHFDFENYQVEVEKNAGIIDQNYTTGGRLDIVITDLKKNRIIIENKVYATDQYKQLWRYHQFDPHAIILYLTLGGEEPSSLSTDGQLINQVHYYCISYAKDMVHWLEQCINLSTSKPRISETIAQYQQTLLELTQPFKNQKMVTELATLIENNANLFLHMDALIQAYQSIQEKIKSSFWSKIESKKPHATVFTFANQRELQYQICEDADGFFFSFQLMKDGVQMGANYEIYQKIASTLQEISPNFHSNDNHLIWVFSERFRKFDQLEPAILFSLTKEEAMDAFVQEIMDELQHYIGEMQKKLQGLDV